MSFHSRKQKTGIPVVKHTPRDNGDGEPLNTALRSQPQAHRQPFPLQPQQSTQNPLAKAMIKKKKTQSSETWADEKIESQSQKMKNYSKAEHLRRKEDMEKQLREAETELVTMTGLLEKREKMLKEAKEDAENQTATLEQKMLEKDGMLIEHGIDPVTGEKIVLGAEGEKKVELGKKFTKKRIQEMREKLQKMSSQTESYLADIENTMNYLGSLEESSHRAGPYSEETCKLFGEAGSEEDFIAKVYTENVPQKAKNDEDSDDDEESNKKGSRIFITDGDGEERLHSDRGSEEGEDGKDGNENLAEDEVP